jgi:hypothetical protein
MHAKMVRKITVSTDMFMYMMGLDNIIFVLEIQKHKLLEDIAEAMFFMNILYSKSLMEFQLKKLLLFYVQVLQCMIHLDIGELPNKTKL